MHQPYMKRELHGISPSQGIYSYLTAKNFFPQTALLFMQLNMFLNLRNLNKVWLIDIKTKTGKSQ